MTPNKEKHTEFKIQKTSGLGVSKSTFDLSAALLKSANSLSWEPAGGSEKQEGQRG